MNEATQRLFFALWPDAATSVALAALAQQIAAESGGRPTAPGNVHLTLAFLGDQPRRITLAVKHPLAPLVWHVITFALVASELDPAGARYRVLSSWPLARRPHDDREVGQK